MNKHHLKITAVFALPALLSFHLQAQYQSLFGNIQTSWNVKATYFVMPIGFFNVTDSMAYTNDTIISGEQRKVLKLNRWASASQDAITLIVKEDTVLGKAWYSILGDTISYLICDMSLVQGDTFYFEGGITKIPIIADTTIIASGKKIIRFNFAPNYQMNDTVAFEMIEGIGTNIGIAYHYEAALAENPFLLCQSKDDTLHFVNNHPMYRDSCRLKEPEGVGITETENPAEIPVIFPNPVSEIVYIKVQENTQIRQMRLFGLNGDEIRVIRMENRIDLSNDSDGVYFIEVQTDKGTTHHRIVKY